MKRRVLYRIALLLAIAMLLTPAMYALADAPESPDMNFEGVGLSLNGELPSLLLDDESIILDIDLEDVLASDGLMDVEILDPDAAAQVEALSVEIDDGTVGAMESMPGSETDALPEDVQGTELALLPDADAMAEGVETIGEEEVQNITLSGGADNDALFEIYLKLVLPGLGPRRSNASAQSGRKSLSGLSLKLYDALVPMIKEVAQGKRVSTLLTVEADKIGLSDSWWTAEQLGLESLDDSRLGTALLAAEGFDQKKIMHALLADCPYDLYWFNKATGGGMGWSYNKTKKGMYARLTNLTAKMSVAADYSKTGEIGTYEVNNLPARVSTAVTNINGIVAGNKDKGDLAKIRAYANRICALVDYNRDAANDPNTPYGDPWQLVFIFDGDDSTKVVCEGYSKGFKYLCDLSDFDGDVACELMSGTLTHSGGSGGHMWNTVRMPDGRYYLADLTNSDGGDSCNEKRFLKGCTGDGEGPYTCEGLTYAYNDNMRPTFGSTWLTLSNADYGKGYAVSTAAEHGAMTASPAVADAGDAVTLTVTPDAGYISAAPMVRFGNQTLNLQQTDVGAWQFTMPFGDVSATAACVGCNVEGYTGVYDGEAHGIAVTTTDASATVKYGTEKGTYDLDASPTWKDAGEHIAYYRIESGGSRATEGEACVKIAPMTVTLRWSDTDFTYDGSAHVPTATAEDILTGDKCTVTVGGAQTGAGDHTATATGLSNGNYALPEDKIKVFAIAPRKIGLSWGANAFTYDGNSHVPAATATGLLPGDSCTVTVAGEQTKVGEYTAVATGLSNGNYVLPEDVTQAFTICRRAVEVLWSNTSFTYDGLSHAPDATVDGLMPGDTCTVSVSGRKTDAGNYTAEAIELSNANYTLTGHVKQAFKIEKRAAELQWENTNLTYSGVGQKPVATVVNLVAGDSCAVTVSGEQTNAGNYTAEATGLSNDNYALPVDAVQAFAIARRTVGLNWSDTRFYYDGKPHAPVASATDLIPGDVCSVTVSGEQTDAGSYMASAVELSNGNYALPAKNTRAFEIAPKTVGLEWTDTSLTYNGKPQCPTATATGLLPGDVCSVTVTGEQTDAGSYAATADAVSNGNYALPEDRTQEYTIAPKTIKLKWTRTSLTYNGKPQKPVATATGLIAGDKCGVTVTGARKSAGSYTARVSKLSNGNYKLPKTKTKTYVIKRKTIKLKWTETRLKYNGKAQKPVATATGLIRGDKCKVTVSGAKKEKGTYTARATKLSNRNYQLPRAATVRFTIY